MQLKDEVIKVAFYKGTRPGIKGIYNIGVRKWTRSPYSHVELIFPDGEAASSSAEDGGVRFKTIEFDPANWDIIELPAALYAQAAYNWFAIHEHEGYDYWGNAHFVVSIIGGNRRRWFCSEAVAAALGIKTPERFDPGSLYAIVKAMADQYKATLNMVAQTGSLQAA